MLRFPNITTVFFKELKELLRDRRSLLVMFGVPLVVYPLLFAGIGAIAKGKATQQRQQLVKLVVVNPDGAPELVRRLNLPENRVSLLTREPSDSAIQKGEIDLVLTIPADAERVLLAPELPPPATQPADSGASSDVPTTQTSSRGPPFNLRVDRSRAESDSAEGRIRTILQGYERWVLERRLEQRSVPTDVLAPLTRTTTDIATQDQRLGRFLAQLLPLLLLVTGMLGAFFPALNATTTERELGTLETLLVTPVSRTELLIAKGILVFACSLLTAGLNLVSMSAVFANIALQARDMGGSGGGGLGGLSINAGALFLAYLATIPALVLFSAVVMCVGMIARTYREANSFAAPVMMLPMAAMAIGMADPATTNALLATPVANTTIIIRDILTARMTLPNFALAAGSNLMFAAVVLSIAARLFTNEQLVNPAWEPLSFKGFKRGKGISRKLRLPTVDEALILIALGVLIQFYAGPWFGKLYQNGTLNIFTLIMCLLTASFALPSLIFASVLRYDLRQVFSLRGFGPVMLGAAVLLGVGLMPLSQVYSMLQQHFFPAEPSDAAQNIAEVIGTGFKSSPWLIALVLGVAPGICEELLFRGVVLSALRKRLSVHAAVWITALLFALIHLDMAGLLPRTVLGAVLGYITVRSGSIFPAMILHALFNFSQVGVIAFHAPDLFSTTQPSSLDDLPAPLKPWSLAFNVRLALGCVMTLFGVVLLRLTRPSKSAV